ncbi:MAG: thymidylate synthase [Candidatus Acidiferrales bacterium]
MLKIQRDSINEVWMELLYHLYNLPEHMPEPRGLKTHECTGVTLRVNDARNNILYHPTRNLNYRFLVAEFLWIAYGRADVATLAHYNSQMARFSDDGLTLGGAYGPRLAPQWQYVVDSLARDYFSRQAVASIWRPYDKAPSSKDVPCTLSLQFIARDGKLNCIATMRSSDIWLGLPYDTSTFSLLQNCVAGVLGLNVGYLQFNLGSSHLYATDFEKAKQVLTCRETYESIRSPRLPYMPPRPSIDRPISLEDVLQHPKKYPDHELPYPWGMYADVLNADNWEIARLLLAGACD